MAIAGGLALGAAQPAAASTGVTDMSLPAVSSPEVVEQGSSLVVPLWQCPVGTGGSAIGGGLAGGGAAAGVTTALAVSGPAGWIVGGAALGAVGAGALGAATFCGE